MLDIVRNTTVNSTEVSTNQTPYGQIEQLVADRMDWENGAYNASNLQLYTLLQRCYSLYLEMCQDKSSAAELRTSLASYIKDNGISVKKSSHTLNQIARCVFGNDRRRVSAYSIVLRTAFASKITAEDLPDFIRRNGGVEEVRLAKSENVLSPKQKADKAVNWISDYNYGAIKNEEITSKLDAAKVGTQHVIVVTQHSDGSLVANAFVSSQSVVNSALAAFYSSEKVKRNNANDILIPQADINV